MKKILLFSAFAGLACIASNSSAMGGGIELEGTEGTERDIAKARTKLANLLRKHPAVAEKIKADFTGNYILNFRTQSNRKRLATLRTDLQRQQATLEERLRTNLLEQKALALFVEIECRGEPEEDKLRCALQ